MGKFKGKTVVMIINQDWYFCSHWKGRMMALKHAGARVFVLVPKGGEADSIRQHFELKHFYLNRKGINPLQEEYAYRQVVRRLNGLSIDLIITSTIKPALIGVRLAKKLKVPSIITLNGLGHIFTDESLKSRLLKASLKLLMRSAVNSDFVSFLFQNKSDPIIFQNLLKVSATQINVISGAGVNTKEYYYSEEPFDKCLKVLFAARLLWNKGLELLVKSVKKAREEENCEIELYVAGILDPGNPKAIPEKYLINLDQNTEIRWLGNRKDMPDLLAQSHLVVLPSSYGEGIPKILIEACSAGRPIITTDTPGCNEICKHEETGLLIQKDNEQELVSALVRLAKDKNLRKKLGDAARKNVEEQYDEEIIVKQTLDLCARLIFNEQN